MLCEICQKRGANVHESTTILKGHPPDRMSTFGPTRHLCEVCAGRKTEQEWDAEEEEQRAASLRRLEETKVLSREIRSELFESRKDLIRSNQIRIHGMAVDRHWNLALVRLSSLLAGVDPLDVLFGPVQTATNHLVKELKDCEVHVIRWHPDAKQQMDYLFEMFPNAGASLDLERKLLFVDAEDKLFPDVHRSWAFCGLAAFSISSGLTTNGRFHFRPKLARSLL